MCMNAKYTITNYTCIYYIKKKMLINQNLYLECNLPHFFNMQAAFITSMSEI